MIIKGKAYCCTVCGTIYDELNARNQAMTCFDSHRPMDHEHEPGGLGQRESKAPGEGIEYPDHYGHFRRLRPKHADYHRLQYHKAHYRLNRDYDSLQQYLNDTMRGFEVWKDKISPLQRLSYAYHYGRWESVKQAAYALAYTKAIQARLNALNIPDLIRELLHLDYIVTKALEDMDEVSRLELTKDINTLKSRLDITEFIDNLEGGLNGTN